MSSIHVSASFIEQVESIVLLVPAEAEMTARDFSRLCDHVEQVGYEGAAGGQTIRSRRLDQLASHSKWKKWYQRLDWSSVSGYQHLFWLTGSVTFRWMRSTEFTTSYHSQDPFLPCRNICCILGLRLRGRAAPGDKRIAEHTAKLCGVDLRHCVVGVHAGKSTLTLLRTLDKLLLEICRRSYVKHITSFSLTTMENSSAAVSRQVQEGMKDVFDSKRPDGSRDPSRRELIHERSWTRPPGLLPTSRVASTSAKTAYTSRWGMPAGALRVDQMQSFKVLADTTMLVAAYRDAAMYAAYAAEKLRLIGEVPCYAGALLTWCAAAAASETDAKSVAAILAMYPLPQNSIGTSKVFNEWDHERVDLKEYSFSKVFNDTQQIRQRIISVCVHTLALLRQISCCALLATEVALKFSRWMIDVGDKRGGAVVLESALAVMSQGKSIWTVETARVAQAAAVICGRSGMWRKAARFAFTSSSILSELRNWHGSLTVAALSDSELIDLCTHQVAWSLSCLIVSDHALRVSMQHGDKRMLMSYFTKALCFYGKLKRKSNIGGVHRLSADETTPKLHTSSTDRNIHLRFLNPLMCIEARETAMLQLPDDLFLNSWLALQPYVLYSSQHVAVRSEMQRNLKVPTFDESLTFSDSALRGDGTTPRLDGCFHTNNTQKSAAKEIALRSCEVGVRLGVTVTIQNDLHTKLHVHSARLVCKGTRGVSHEHSYHELHGVGSSSLNLEVSGKYTLFFTPLEPGLVCVVGVLLRTSVFVTTNRMFLKEQFYAVNVSIKDDSQLLQMVQTRSCRHPVSTNPAVETLNECEGLRVKQPFSQLASFLQFAPYVTQKYFPRNTLTLQWPSKRKKPYRKGELLALWLSIVSSSAMPLQDVMLWARPLQRSVCDQQHLHSKLQKLNGRVLRLYFDHESIRGASLNDSETDFHAERLQQSLLRSSAHVVTLTILLVCPRAAPSAGTLSLSYSMPDHQLNPKIDLPYQVYSVPGISITCLTFTARDQNCCDARFRLQNASDSPVLVWYNNCATMVYAKSTYACVTVKLPRASSEKCSDAAGFAHRLLCNKVGWLIDGSEGGVLDGVGWLQLPSTAAFLNCEALVRCGVRPGSPIHSPLSSSDTDRHPPSSRQPVALSSYPPSSRPHFLESGDPCAS